MDFKISNAIKTQKQVCLRGYLSEICDEEVESLILNQPQERKVDGLLDQTDELNEVTRLLQFDGI